jgi:hypothetical protein
MAQQKLEFFNEDQVEVLKEMYENEWSAFHPSDILANIVGYLPSTITVSFYSDVDDESENHEEHEDIDLVSVTYSDYTNQPLGMAEAEFKKSLDKFVTELKKVFKEVTGKTLTMTEYEENPNVNRSYWKTSMQTEMFHYEMVYEYNFPEDKDFSYDKKDPADGVEFKYDGKKNSEYSEKFDEDLGYDDLEILNENVFDDHRRRIEKNTRKMPKAMRGVMGNYGGDDLLTKLMDNGDIFLDGETYVGKASDGVEVQIGMVGEEDRIEKYLKSYPSPDTW